MRHENPFVKAFSGKKALIPFITVGYPYWDVFERLVEGMVQAGADIIEIGIPFSDPLADGITIQKSSQIAIEHGATLKRALKVIESLSPKVKVPIVIMSYYNPILSYGIESFVKDAKCAGVSGVIIPDLPFDEREPFYHLCKERGISPILMITPVTPHERLERIIKDADGFIYCVSLVGLTGDSKKPIFQWISRELPKIREVSPVPIVLGFGIDSTDTAMRVSPFTDGIVVGSALIKMIEREISLSSWTEDDLLDKVKNFIKSFKKSLKD